MSHEYRILDQKSRFSHHRSFLFLFLLLCLLSTVDGVYATPIPDVGCEASTDLKDKGCWKTVFSSGPIVHATVLPNGYLLNWSSYGPHGYARIWNCGLTGDPDKKLCSLSNTNQDVWFTSINIFCSGHSLMPDGKVIITGGSDADPAVFGESRATTFDYTKIGTGNSPWKTDPDVDKMDKGRWYPTNVALGNGGTLVAAGLYKYGGQSISNDVPEILPAPTPVPSPMPSPSPTPQQWSQLTGAGNVTLPLYPWLYYGSNGKVFYAGPTQQARWLNITGSGSWVSLSDPSTPSPSTTYRESGSSVMYDVDKVMVSGGGPVAPVATNEVIDISSSTPSWQSAASMAFARKHHNLTIMADGKILATGGTKGVGFNNTCERQVVYEAEMWTPFPTNSWATMAKMSINRRYHSTAVLLKDGRVMVGGSDGYPSTPMQCHPALPSGFETEIFTPPYLFDSNGNLAARPRVTSITGGTPGVQIESGYGSTISIGMADSTTISKVTLIRLSSVTHSFNMNQRINYLSVQQSGSGLSITTPANSSVCPPGHYLMFIINSSGVPSVAETVRIS